ncbi:DUF916 domain-containing protein [Actinoplanes sp. NBC_00393]|uniref:COG1470 family protein n=1 Tax=Actinoplanes sp. NBC_00393 TaxID=2975953 RepID=UPI002E1EA3FA
MRRPLAVLAALLTAAAPAAIPGPASAAPAAVTWTVQPASATAPDGRRWMEHTLDPGAQLTEHLAVRNLGDTTAVFALSAADGYLTGKGRFNMLPSGQKSVDGGTWIDVQDTVTVEPGRTAVVPFTITVPADAAPGDHPAGIAASIAGRQGTVQVESRVGFRVLLRAAGAITPALATSNVLVQHERSWNPLRPGTVQVSYTVANTGNVRLDVTASARTAGRSADTPIGELLPGGTRAVETRIDGVWPLGRLRTTVGLDSAAPHSLTVTTWAMPWPQLLLAAALIGLSLALRAINCHRRRRLESLLAQARLEGAKSVAS